MSGLKTLARATTVLLAAATSQCVFDGTAPETASGLYYLTDPAENQVIVLDLEEARHSTAPTLPPNQRVGVGERPREMVLDPAGEFLYVTGERSDQVYVLSAIDGTLTDSLPAGPRPVSLDLNQTGDLLYIGSIGLDSVSVVETGAHGSVKDLFDRAPGRLVARFALPSVGWLTKAPGGPLLVTMPDDSAVAVIETAGYSVTDVIRVGAIPQTITATHDGATAYVANFADRTVSVIDVASSSVSAVISLEPPEFGGPFSVTLSPNGRFLYVTVFGTPSAVHEIDLETGETVRSFEAPFFTLHIAVTDDGGTVLVTSSDGQLAVIDLATGCVQPFAVGATTLWGVAVAPTQRFSREPGAGRPCAELKPRGAGLRGVGEPTGNRPAAGTLRYPG